MSDIFGWFLTKIESMSVAQGILIVMLCGLFFGLWRFRPREPKACPLCGNKRVLQVNRDIRFNYRCGDDGCNYRWR